MLRPWLCSVCFNLLHCMPRGLVQWLGEWQCADGLHPVCSRHIQRSLREYFFC